MKAKCKNILQKIVFILALLLVAGSIITLTGTENVYAASKINAVSISSVVIDDGSKTVITWSSVKSATGYKIWRKTSTDKKWVKAGTTDQLHFVDKKLRAKVGTNVEYMIRAYRKNSKGKVTWGKKSAAYTLYYYPRSADRLLDEARNCFGYGSYFDYILADINDDGEPDIILKYNGNYKILTTQQGKITEFLSGESYNWRDTYDVEYYPKTNVIKLSKTIAGLDEEVNGEKIYGYETYTDYYKKGKKLSVHTEVVCGGYNAYDDVYKTRSESECTKYVNKLLKGGSESFLTCNI